jgi:protein TonB
VLVADVAGMPPVSRRGFGFGSALAVALVVEAAAILMLVAFVRPAPPPPPPAPKMHIHAAVTMAPPPTPAPPPPVPAPPVVTPPPAAVAPPVPAPPPPRPLPVRPRGHVAPRPRIRPPVPPPAAPVTMAEPAPPAPQPVSAAVQASETDRYAASLRARVQANLQVPETVRMLGISGVADVRIGVGPDGTLTSVAVSRSSGSGEIDRAALEAVRSTRLPPFSANMPHHPITFVLAVRLDN